MKYIIEIEEKPLCVFDKDTQTYFPRLWRVKGFNSLVFDEEGLSRLEELNADYINENYGQLQDDAYQKGFEDGYKKCEKDYADSIEDLLNNTRNAGMNRAWECAKKIVCGEENGGLTSDELVQIFNRVYIDKIFRDFSAQEAIEKIEAYEEEMLNEIHVNDEVQMGDLTGIVFKIEDGVAYGICNNTPQFTPFRWVINECQKLRSNVISANEFMKGVVDA